MSCFVPFVSEIKEKGGDGIEKNKQTKDLYEVPLFPKVIFTFPVLTTSVGKPHREAILKCVSYIHLS